MSEDDYRQILALLEARRQPSSLDEALLGRYPETVSASLFSKTDAQPPDCQSCGACCAYFHQIPVQIQDATPRSLTWQVFESNDPDELPLHWLQRELKSGNCIAFEGQVGGRAHCKIYQLRPQACRAFEAGSDRCHALRRFYGMEPELSGPERQAHLKILNEHLDADEFSCEDEIAPDETNKSAWLCELIDFNLGKLAEIEDEINRVQDLVEETNNCEAVTFCEQSRLEITDNYRAIFDTLAQIDFPSEAVFRELLQIGNFSQECVERAAEQIAQIGELAFQVSGMKKSVEK